MSLKPDETSRRAAAADKPRARLSMARALGQTRLPGSESLARAAGAVAARAAILRQLIAGFAGVLAALAQAPFYLLPLLAVSFTMLVWLIDGLGRHERRLFAAGLVGWAFGFGYFAAGVYWIGSAFLVDADTFGAVMPFAMAGLWAGLALFPAAAIVLARLFWSESSARVLVLAVAFAAIEWVRGHIFTGFPWNSAGYVWGDTLSVLQSASLFGLYGLSFLTVLAAAAPAALVQFRSGRPEAAGLPAAGWLIGSLVIFAALAGWGQVRLAADEPPPQEGVRLRLVQPSVPQAEKRPINAGDIFSRHVALMTAPGADNITLFIWPEGAVPVLVAEAPDVLAAFDQLLAPGQKLILGATRREARRAGRPERYFNSLHVVGETGAIIATYDKHHLVPFGEYLPWPELFAQVGLRQIVENASGYTPGPALQTLKIAGLPAFGPLICYEAIFPGAVVDPKSRPAWLLNMTDDTWFGDSSGPRQHFAAARTRAIEEGLPIVRAANNGISAVITARGEIVARLDLDEVSHLDASLPLPQPATLYARAGDLVFFLMLAAGIGGIGLLGFLGKGQEVT